MGKLSWLQKYRHKPGPSLGQGMEAGERHKNFKKEDRPKGLGLGLKKSTDSGPDPARSSPKLNLKEKISFYGLGFAMLVLLTWLFYANIWPGLIFSPILFFLENIVAEEVDQRKKQRWEEAFSKYLEELDSHIRLGHSLELGTKQAIKDNDLLKTETWMVDQLEMNVYIADIFQSLAEKKQVESLTHFAGVLGSALKSGSNLHDLMQNSMVQIQKRIKTEEEIQSILTKVKYESRILIFLVPLLLVYLKSLSPNFTKVMYHSIQGRLVMTVCLGIYILATYLCHSMTQVDL